MSPWSHSRRHLRVNHQTSSATLKPWPKAKWMSLQLLSRNLKSLFACWANVRAVSDASKVLKQDPKPYLSHISSVIGFSQEEFSLGWPETNFPVAIIPDMLDVLVTEEPWLAKVSNRAPRSRAELEKFIDRSVVKEALSSR